MQERLCGIETEYAFTLADRNEQRVPQSKAIERLMIAAQRRLPHLPGGSSSGMFLQNGARFYIDCGGHPEMTTPECPNPWDAVRYLKAGEQILMEVIEELLTQQQSAASFFRHNVDYSGTGSTWGSHESYLHRASPALFRKNLIPHLVSRLIYTGAGGFDSLCPGIKFTLSPRVPHLEQEVSPISTNARGILHTKDEPLSSRGYHRLHLLCSESLFSEVALFLRLGVTALIVALIEAGLNPGHGVNLANSLRAMAAFAADPDCKVEVKSREGNPLTAIGIQRHYLRLAEEHVDASFMPPWAAAVCQQWRAMLERLEQGCPGSVARSLDWSVKHCVFDDLIRRSGFDWDLLHDWNDALAIAKVEQAASGPIPAEETAPEMLHQASLFSSLRGPLPPKLRQRGASWDDLPRLLSLREKLFEIDTRFGKLGEKGIFTTLDQTGVLDMHLAGVDNIEDAMVNPPAIGRARLRGICVRRFGSSESSRRGFACDWTMVRDNLKRRTLDLSDPFAREEKWQDTPPVAPGSEGWDQEMILRLRRLRAERQPAP